MTFTERLEDHASRVERHLDEWLSTDKLGAVPDRLLDAMRYGTLGGGKRFRPFLVIESAALFGVPVEKALNAGSALECIHCYSLVHDDLPAMDNDDLRRGRPTVHKAFDDATAILAGDTLLTVAFEIIAHESTHPNPAVRAALGLELARASGGAGMAGGQMLDLMAPGKTLGEADIRTLQAMKTGALITYGCVAGGILGEASKAELAALKTYGDALGAAFQLADDLLDAEGDASVVGKATGKDQEAGKGTLVSLLGLEAAHAKLQNLKAEALGALAPFKGRDAMLVGAAEFVVARKF
ncbi:geranylgeranyl pyrophosphate synthase [Rhodomicrobium udaipurense JA643]|uniref:Probable farnesyl diphosphate synthase n=1 Tax=Rhodomicrobium udaipurense TaxID=1202716 RepID=A0A8I1G991_9HYPH|nr:farnesyl diphosphate synthase [Rhodomicrobium udaipurense]KAI94299.1 geranylgeranyl pyrophosphate synthase [Rhodomicrobium udaipurense JA643]MBJ7542898.1 polyprenyl synthetase family protein [Rhodomicrobium udaipurense]